MADTILFVHLCVIAFIVSCFFFVPIGSRLGWKWTAHKRIRLIHMGLIGLVTLEAVLGVTCPLTILENYLHGDYDSTSFVGYWIKRLIYWNFPSYFFVIIYMIGFGWTLLMWKIFPPKNYED